MRTALGSRTIFELNCDSFIRTFHKESSRWSALLRWTSLEVGAQLGDLCTRIGCEAYLTSFILACSSRDRMLQAFVIEILPGYGNVVVDDK